MRRRYRVASGVILVLMGMFTGVMLLYGQARPHGLSVRAIAAPVTAASAEEIESYVEAASPAPDVDVDDNLGYAVALQGDTLVAGAYWTKVDGKEKAGAAYLFRRSGENGAWTQVARLTAGDAQAFDQFGASVAIDGDLIAVGATGVAMNGGASQGAVYVFERSQSDLAQWDEVKKLVVADLNDFAGLGDALAVQGDEIFAGAKDADVGTVQGKGALFLFRRDTGGENNWGPAGMLTDPEGRSNDSFASALAVDGDWLVAGAERADVTGLYENDGAALLFRRQPQNGEWTFFARLTAGDADGSDRFGASVALDGERVLVGAPAAERNGDFGVGKAYLFEQNQGGVDSWGQTQMLTAGNGRPFDGLGVSVALDAGTAFVGANAADVAAADEGAVYLFSKGEAGIWEQSQMVAAGDGQLGDNFGRSLAAQGEILAVGAHLAAGARGKVYIYTPQKSVTHQHFLPWIVTRAFVATLELTDGQTVTGPDGLKLGATPGALDASLGVSIARVDAPELPVPLPATPAGAYYEIRAEREVIRPLHSPFVLALPVSNPATPTQLAAAVYGPSKHVLDAENPEGSYWGLAPGVYDADAGLLLVPWPSLSVEGQIVVVVEHPDMVSPARDNGAGVSATAMQPETQSGTTTGNFVVACHGLTCDEAVKREVGNLMQQQLADFVVNYAYPHPRISGVSSNMSVDPPQINQPSDHYFTFIFPYNAPGCTDRNNLPAYAGAYNPKLGAVWICLASGSDPLTDYEKETVWHEYFHAQQYTYDQVLADWENRESEDWIIEGLADAVIQSGEQWQRTDAREIRPVDKSLREESDQLAYRAQDLWVYLGRNLMVGGIERLKPILNKGATADAVFANLNFDHDYFEWVRNQTVEKNDTLDGVLGAGCKLEEQVVSELDVWTIDLNYASPIFVGNTSILNSSVVELDFTDEWAGRPANIWAVPLPIGSVPPPWFNYKVYRTPWPNCTSTPENEAQSYKITPGERYFVVIANSGTEREIHWKIHFE